MEDVVFQLEGIGKIIENMAADELNEHAKALFVVSLALDRALEQLKECTDVKLAYNSVEATS